MRVLGIRRGATSDAVRLSARIGRQRTRDEVEAYIEFAAGVTADAPALAEPFAAASLLPSMRAAEALEVIPPISPRLAFSLPRIRDIFHTWWPHLARVVIDTVARPGDDTPRVPRAATFFSGGVDSFYSLLKHRTGNGTLPAPLTHIIFMRGVETKLEHSKGVDASEAWVREVAAAAGVECVVGESNIRSVLQGPGRRLHYENYFYGSILSAVALSLSSEFGYVCIPSGFSYNAIIPIGSTPLVDEMYSSDALQVVHDGSEVTRPEKVAKILEWDRDLVLSRLRVCILNSGGAFNCGQCYKCIRTGIALRALGVWDQATTFADRTTDRWESTMVKDRVQLIEENVRFVRAHGGDAWLVAMLERVMRRRRRREAVQAFVENSPAERLVPVVQRARSLFRRD